MMTALAVQDGGLRATPRTSAEKRRLVLGVLADPQWRGRSNREIAHHCGVERRLVGKCRMELSGNGSQIATESRPVTHHGTASPMDTGAPTPAPCVCQKVDWRAFARDIHRLQEQMRAPGSSALLYPGAVVSELLATLATLADACAAQQGTPEAP
jgi:hypothetical protein